MRVMKAAKIIAAIILVVLTAAGAYVLLLIEERPDGPPPLTSTPHGQEMAGRNAPAAAWLADLYDAHDAPSVSAAVGLGGRLIWSGTVGYADMAARRPADAATAYRIGSISKSLTAVSAVRLSERGVIDLEAGYATYVPDFPTAGAGYSLKQLLSHQAGIRHYRGMDEMLSGTAHADMPSAAAIFAKDPLLFPPGAGFHYSSYGYTAVALALERATQRPFAQIIADEVLIPAGMMHTRLDRQGAASQGPVAARYALLGGVLFPAPRDDVSDRYAGGGLLSTPADLVVLANGLTTGKLLKPETRALMWTPVPLADGSMNPERYALGFREGADERGRFLHHGGSANGGSAMLLIYPDLRLAVALCANYSTGADGFDRLAAAQRLAALFMP